jgi:xylose isomerase
MECFLVTVCPLADGHDYVFEVDYGQAWRWLRDGIREAAQYRPDVKISLEYKRSETRAHGILGSAGMTLHLCHQIGLPNVGVTLDIGHALYNAETPAQIVALLADAGRLFLVHVNDNYRDADWDMIPGTVNFWDWLETMLYLDEVGYEGWLTSDVFPARLDPFRVANITIKFIRTILSLLEKIGAEELRRLVRKGDVLDTFAYVQERLRDG